MPDALLHQRRPTSYDVARIAEVAQSTVSRCFQGDRAISAGTQQRVREVASRLGYVPNTLARGLITRQSNMVGVVLTQATLRSNPDVIYAIGQTLGAAGKQLLLMPVERDRPPIEALRGALEYPLDGLVCCVLLADGTLAELMRRRLAIVFYNRAPPGFAVDCVSADHETAAAELARLLHGAGHRRFLCIAGPVDAPVSRQRMVGFSRGLSALGVAPAALRHTDYSYAGGRAALLAHLRSAPTPDAVFCANDQTAMGAMDAARYDLQLTVPHDLSVVGADDVPEAARPPYELTTIHQESVAMAQEAVRLLLRRVADPAQPRVCAVMPTTLVRRRSARLAPDRLAA